MREVLGNVVGIVASLLASSCCIAPTLFVIFGVSLGGFGGSLRVFDPYRGWFLLIGYLSVGYSIYSFYLKNWVKEKILGKPVIECACEEGKLNKISKTLTWISLIFLIFATFYPYVLPLVLEG